MSAAICGLRLLHREGERSDTVIAGDKREAIAQRSEPTKQSITARRYGLLRFARNDVRGRKLPSRPQFQAFQPGSNADADLALHAQGLQRDRVGGASDQHIAAYADTERGAALRADIVAGEVARPEPRYRCEHAPGQRRFLGDTEIEADFPDGG